MKRLAPNPITKQGRHIDPLEQPLVGEVELGWPPRRSRAYASSEMREFRAGLMLPNEPDVRASVLNDLSTFFGLDRSVCVERCINWERWSVDEWHAERRDSPSAITRFYHTTQSWAFDLLWYTYLQSEGFEYPLSVALAQSASIHSPGRYHLDFGSGVGVTSQLFSRLGYDTDLADISGSLLEFARFRLDRRGQLAGYIDLNFAALPTGRYDVITAIDTLVHIPDLRRTIGELYRALRPGGLLFANFDARPKSDENAWHLYDDDLPLRWQLQRAGFEPEVDLDGRAIQYRKVAPSGMPHALRGARDAVLLRSPLRPAYRRLRSSLRSALR